MNNATDIINISGQNEKGKLVYEQRIGEKQPDLTIDVSHLASGIYTIVMQSGEVSSTKRLIVQ